MKHSPEELKRMAGVMLAAEWKYKEHIGWYPAEQPTWEWHSYDYRVKPEPMELELWTHPLHPEWGVLSVLERDDESGVPKGGWVKRKFREVVDSEEQK